MVGRGNSAKPASLVQALALEEEVELAGQLKHAV